MGGGAIQKKKKKIYIPIPIFGPTHFFFTNSRQTGLSQTINGKRVALHFDNRGTSATIPRRKATVFCSGEHVLKRSSIPVVRVVLG